MPAVPATEWCTEMRGISRCETSLKNAAWLPRKPLNFSEPKCPHCWHIDHNTHILGFPGGTSGKEPACQWRRHRDVDSIPGSGRSLRGGHDNPLQYSSWRIPWTEEPGGLQSTGLQRDTAEVTWNTHMHSYPKCTVKTGKHGGIKIAESCSAQQILLPNFPASFLDCVSLKSWDGPNLMENLQV